MNERQVIELLAGRQGGENGELRLGIGDDCAVIAREGERAWLVTLDTLIESVHFDLGWHPPEKLGRKSLAVNVSDIAAMGGTPRFAFLSLGLPADFDPGWLDRFAAGLGSACERYNCRLAGGDTVRSTSGVLISITLVGEAESSMILLRSGARPGDDIWVSGTLGSAAAGLSLCRAGMAEDRWRELIEAHLDPPARPELGKQLALSGAVHSMMDISDGLATDLAHLCRQSGTGGVIHPERIPASPLLPAAAEVLQVPPRELLLSGGEDFELLFTAPHNGGPAIEEIGRRSGIKLSRIGKIDDKQGVRLAGPMADDGSYPEEDVSYRGYDHFVP